MIQEKAPSFVRDTAQGDMQIQVVLAVSVAELIVGAPAERGWNVGTTMAAVLWSTLAYQTPVKEEKLERLRQYLLEVSRKRSLEVAGVARRRQPVPEIGAIGIDQDSPSGTRVN